jgi:assimilatory nitrate reductase electron transfer subunit
VNVVVVGYGMAGARVVSELSGHSPGMAVTVVGGEPHRAYNRILLSNVIAGKTGEREVTLAEPNARRVDLRLGVEATALNLRQRTVSTSEGNEIPYDRLVLATGSRAMLPPIKGLTTDDGRLPDRVAAFRTLDDCRRIAALAAGARTALVLGGGLLGLEAARALATRGLAVTVLHALGHVMERQLDPAASAVLVNALGALGVQVELDASTVAIESGPNHIEAVLGDGRRLVADFFVVACGVRPETGLAERAGLAVERGIVVDDRLRTSDRAVFAIGDCAQHGGVVTGLVAPAWEQARVVAGVVTGDRPLGRYRPSPAVTRLKVSGIDLAAMGESTSDDGERVTFADPARGTYAKLLIRDNRLAGAILLGDNPTVGTLIQLFDRGGPLPTDVRSLLLGRSIGGPAAVGPAVVSPALMPDGAVVCRCNTVTKGALVGCWRNGARSTVEISTASRAGTGCGSCLDAVEGLVEWLGTTEGVAA